jgi:hypothetical protein
MHRDVVSRHKIQIDNRQVEEEKRSNSLLAVSAGGNQRWLRNE